MQKYATSVAKCLKNVAEEGIICGREGIKCCQKGYKNNHEAFAKAF